MYCINKLYQHWLHYVFQSQWAVKMGGRLQHPVLFIERISWKPKLSHDYGKFSLCWSVFYCPLLDSSRNHSRVMGDERKVIYQF